MDAKTRIIVKHLKEEVCRFSKRMEMANKSAVVKGTRCTLPLKGRDIDIVYYPAKSKNSPLIVGFHGGGFLFGGCALDDDMWNAVRNQLNVNIASIGYRKSPEYMYMAALEDAYDSVVYLKENASEYGFNPENISTMGSSAGAGLAATLCLYAKEKGCITIRNQVLIYPFLDVYTDPLSKGEGSLHGEIMYVFNELHCKPEDAKLPLVSPVYADIAQLKGLPRAILCYAENDNLKAEGEIYAKMLKEAGVEVAELLAKKMPHGFFETGFGEKSNNEIGFFGEEFIAMIKDGTIPKTAQEALDFIDKEFKR